MLMVVMMNMKMIVVVYTADDDDADIDNYNEKPKVPGLVNPSMLKEGKDGTQRLNGTMRKKMGEMIVSMSECYLRKTCKWYQDILQKYVNEKHP